MKLKEQIKQKLKPDLHFIINILLILVFFSSFLNYSKVFIYTNKVSKKIDLTSMCQDKDQTARRVYVYEFKNPYNKGKIYCTYENSKLNKIVFIRKLDGKWVAGSQTSIGNGFIWPYLF